MDYGVVIALLEYNLQLGNKNEFVRICQRALKMFEKDPYRKIALLHYLINHHPERGKSREFRKMFSRVLHKYPVKRYL